MCSKLKCWWWPCVYEELHVCTNHYVYICIDCWLKKPKNNNLITKK